MWEGWAFAKWTCFVDHERGKVHKKVKRKLSAILFGFDYLGEHEVKNIKEPVRVYKLPKDTESTVPLVNAQLERTLVWRTAPIVAGEADFGAQDFAVQGALYAATDDHPRSDYAHHKASA